MQGFRRRDADRGDRDDRAPQKVANDRRTDSTHPSLLDWQGEGDPGVAARRAEMKDAGGRDDDVLAAGDFVRRRRGAAGPGKVGRP